MSIAKGHRDGIAPILVTVIVVIAIIALGAILLPGVPVATSTQNSDEGGNIAVITGYIPTFGATISAAGLADLLKSEGPFTVFAPHEGAFAKLPAGTLDDLLRPENRAHFQALMRYHIVPGKFTLADLKQETRLQTLDGGTLDVRTAAGVITINGARIITPDMAATNGVIHVVSAVLMPPN